MTTKLHELMMTNHADETLQQNRTYRDWYVRSMMGKPPKAETETGIGDDMRILSGGDVYVTQPQPPQQPTAMQQPQKSSSLGPLLAAGLGMLGPLGGVAGYFVNQAMQARQPAAATVNESRDAPASPFASTINTREELGVRILSEDELLP